MGLKLRDSSCSPMDDTGLPFPNIRPFHPLLS